MSGSSRIKLWGNCVRSIRFCAASQFILLFVAFATSTLRAQTISGLLVRAPAPPSGSVEGWTLSVKSTVDSGSGIKPRVTISRYRVSARRARTDILLEGSAPNSRIGGAPVMLVDDSAHTTIFFVEKQRSATVTSQSSRVDIAPRHDSLSRFVTTPVMTIRDHHA